jgi:hypothetical protein
MTFHFLWERWVDRRCNEQDYAIDNIAAKVLVAPLTST